MHIQELPEAGGFHNDFRGCADMDGEGWGAAVFTPDEWLCQQGPIERALQALVGLNHDVLTAVKSLKRAVEGSNDNCMSVSALTEDVVVWKEASCRYASLPTMCRLGNPEDRTRTPPFPLVHLRQRSSASLLTHNQKPHSQTRGSSTREGIVRRRPHRRRGCSSAPRRRPARPRAWSRGYSRAHRPLRTRRRRA